MLKKNLKGFTLVELLVVIAIIAILATVSVLTYGTQKDKASNSTIKSNLTDSFSASVVCSSDSGVVSTPLSTGGNAICAPTTSINAVWPQIAKTDATWTYLNWTQSTAVKVVAAPTIPAGTTCSNSSTEICAVGGGTSSPATIGSATKAAKCSITNGGCVFYGDGM